ncbi:hypothetical protein PF005_g18899 [Phytophthora fragariae]|uniref:Uncharacterized protein n=1 Tax=Phytophthora fragariae TaxID=53985 RepID=A0A6A3R828_9STRA|nr:hypothetical protein PF003_g11796 [Phytophthora fragariae]KAE8930075.1 hypothetical protein PF009_g19830 [Phytophthora fragariae]KAE8991755.1 hypothetical protein PF011_g17820 [Phytophthora fragariae]KAE9091329.1 hypothetical protein PF007_g18926 [Phytophthora fragariae]KAE9093035.1 hypothetical protein PF010_g17649 [Phytophthora fragariae]
MATEPLPPTSARGLDQQQQQRRLQQFLDRGRVPPRERRPERASNDVTDILGARPLLKNHVYVNKQHFYDAHDIKGSTSMELHPKNWRAGSDDRFKQLPIEGTTSQPAGFRTDRVVNPLEPSYKLPSFIKPPPLEPKFLRDSYNVSDIEGTSIKIRDVLHPRDGLKVDDIAGTQCGWLPRHKRGLRENPPRDILNVQDITNVDFRSSRVTNVLNPVYTVNGMTFGDDPLSRPLVQHPKRDKPSYALKTDDIEGASCADPAAAIVAGIVMAHRRNFRDTNVTEDIMGAKADTLLHSIRSTRRVDPNAPQYSALDGSRVDASAISVGKSIVFADLMHQHELLEAAHKRDGGELKPYAVSGVGNVGLLGSANRDREKRPPGAKRVPLYGDEDPPPRTAPVNAAKMKTDLMPAITGGRSKPSKSSKQTSVSGGASRNERKQAAAKREEIKLVRELS